VNAALSTKGFTGRNLDIWRNQTARSTSAFCEYEKNELYFLILSMDLTCDCRDQIRGVEMKSKMQ
jgi:hypothetical protein